MMISLPSDMQRFQAPYNLKAIPEVQEYLNVAFEKSKHHGDLQDLYRRRYAVIELLTRFSLCSYFLFPEVSWSNQNNLLTNLQPATCVNCSTGRPARNPNHKLHRLHSTPSVSRLHHITQPTNHFISYLLFCFLLPHFFLVVCIEYQIQRSYLSSMCLHFIFFLLHFDSDYLRCSHHTLLCLL